MDFNKLELIAKIIFWTVIIIFFIINFIKNTKKRKVAAEKMESFAVSDGYSYQKRAEKEVNKSIFSRDNYLLQDRGKSSVVWNYIKGKKENFELEIFNCSSIGYHGNLVPVTVFQVFFNHNLPKIFIKKIGGDFEDYLGRLIPDDFLKLSAGDSLEIYIGEKEYPANKDIIFSIMSLKFYFLAFPLVSYQFEIVEGNISLYFYEEIKNQNQFDKIIDTCVKFVKNILENKSVGVKFYSEDASIQNKISYKINIDQRIDTSFQFGRKITKYLFLFIIAILFILSLFIVPAVELIGWYVIAIIFIKVFLYLFSSSQKINRWHYITLFFVILIVTVFDQIGHNYEKYGKAFPREVVEQSILGRFLF